MNALTAIAIAMAALGKDILGKMNSSLPGLPGHGRGRKRHRVINRGRFAMKSGHNKARYRSYVRQEVTP